MTRAMRFGLIGWLALTLASPLVAQPFTYQGFLKQNGQPVNGTTSLTFKLFTALTGGSQIGGAITQNVNVQNGLFTVELNFGNVWTGADRYLEISVGSTTLSPRVKITPTPYASFAMRPWQTSGSNIFYNDGNVGIGTSSPTERLHVVGNIRLADDSSIFGLDQLVGFNDLRFFGDATGGPDLYISSAGNVGIGTSSPAARLSLGGGDANTKLAIWQGAGPSDVMGLGVGPAQFRLHLHNATNRFSFLDAPNGSEIMTILGNGRVGIGTSYPEYVLDVRTDTNNRAIFARNAASGGMAVAGLAAATSSNNYGVVGQSNSPDGIGVLGHGAATSGRNCGVLGQSNSPDGYAGYFLGRGYFSDKVGIGIETPEAKLHVNGGNAYFTNSGTTLQILPGNLFGQSQANAATLEIPGNGIIGIWDTLRTTGDLNVGGGYFSLGGGTDPTWRRVDATLDNLGGGAFVGVVRTFGPRGSSNTRLTWMAGYPDHGAVGVANAHGDIRALMYIYDDGMGRIWADAKSFRVPDPDDPTRDIWYGCIEGPELAMYVRGTARLVNGRARIELPDHFRKLADEQGMTVQLTPLSPDSKGLCVVRKGLDGIEVAELLNGRGNYEFDWRVEAVRKEHRDFQVYRPWDEVLPGGTDPAEAWEARLKSIQARQARQQSRTDNKGAQH